MKNNIFILNNNFSEKKIKNLLNYPLNTLHLSISKSEVQRKDYTKLNKVLRVFNKYANLSCGKLYLTFEGYINNPLEIYEIDEIRTYVQELFEKEPNLFYFLSPMAENNFIIMRCFFENNRVKSVDGQIYHYVEFDWEFAIKIVLSFIEYAQQNNNIQFHTMEVFNLLMPYEYLQHICDLIGLEKV